VENNQDFVIKNGILDWYKGPGGDVIIPEGVTAIGNRVFTCCANLTSVIIPEGVKKIGGYAFYGCTGLTSVTIPAGVTEIGEGVFGDCRPILIAPHIPISSIAREAKPGACVGFARAYLDGREIDEEIKAGYLKYIKGQKKRLFPLSIQHEELLRVMFAEKMIVRKDIDPLLEECDKQSNISAKAAVRDYAGRSLKLVDPLVEMEKELAKAERIAEHLEKTGSLPIGELKKLWSWKTEDTEKGTFVTLTSWKGKDGPHVTIPAKIGEHPVKAIGELAFSPGGKPKSTREAWQALQSVTIPEGVTKIGDSAFEDCKNLTSVTIPESVTEIGERAFLSCPKLANHQGMVIIHDILFEYIGSGEDVTIPKGIMEIGCYAFYDRKNLTSVTIPESVRKIGEGAFCNCARLTSVTIPAGVTVIGNSAFCGCKNLTGVTIPAGVTEIEWETFFVCTSLTSVTIPEGVTVIGDSAFEGCASLTSVTIPESVTEIGERVFKGCPKLANQLGMVIIHGILFEYFGSGGDVTIPEGVTEIGQEAFRDCANLTRVTIPKGVTEIGWGAFKDCENLTIHAPAGSAAEQYAKENDIRFEAAAE